MVSRSEYRRGEDAVAAAAVCGVFAAALGLLLNVAWVLALSTQRMTGTWLQFASARFLP